MDALQDTTPAGRHECLAVPMTAYSCGGSLDLCVCHVTGSIRVCGSTQRALLAACTEFRTLAGHVDRILGSGASAESRSALLANLSELAQAGWILTDREILARSQRRAPAPPLRLNIDWLALPVRHAIEAHEPAIASYLLNARRHGRTPRVLLVDDDCNIADERRRHEVAALASRLATPLHYIGAAERHRLCERLVRAGIPADVCDFAVFGPGLPLSRGGTWNTTMLHTVGERVLCVNEPGECQTLRARSLRLRDTLVLTSERDPAESRFLHEAVLLSPEAEVIELDVVGAHAELLGRTPATLVADALARQMGVAFERPGADVLKSVLRNAGTVALTWAGRAGPVTHEAADFLVATSPATRARLAESALAFDVAVTAPQLLRHAEAMTIARGGDPQPSLFGLDNTEMLPPFVPCRGVGLATFGAAVRACAPDGWHGHVPWAVASARMSQVEALRDSAPTPRLRDVFEALIDSYESSATCGDRSARLRSLGAYLGEFARLPVADFSAEVRRLVRRRTFAAVAYREALLRAAPPSAMHWRTELRRQMHAMLHAMGRPNYHIPGDASRPLDSQATEQLREIVARLGSLYQWWPAIRVAARGSVVPDPLHDRRAARPAAAIALEA